MPGIKDILEIEQARPAAEDWYKIHLFQEGSFYRAYEVSAWLCHLHISQFKVTHRHVNGIEQTIAFVGFPLSSLEKRRPENAVVETIADKHVVLQLPQPLEVKSAEEMKEDYAVWKSLQPVSETKDVASTDKDDRRDTSKVRTQQKNGTSLFGVAQQLMGYPIESHSPIECMLFLADVKRQLSGLF